jgi:hypothetical protein
MVFAGHPPHRIRQKAKKKPESPDIIGENQPFKLLLISVDIISFYSVMLLKSNTLVKPSYEKSDTFHVSPIKPFSVK